MMRSMSAGVSGLRAHQLMMDVVGDNIANINTPGFKSSRTVFQDTLSQLMRSGSAGSADSGGVNPQQVGLGVRVGAIDMSTTQGPITNTGRPTDAAIQGEGYFVIRAGQEQLFTRAGSFNFDDYGNLNDPAGAVVQGWLAAPDGTLITTGPAGDVSLPLGQAIDPVPTQSVQLGGNLSAQAKVEDKPLNTALEVVDSLGTKHRVSFEFSKAAGANAWTMRAIGPEGVTLEPAGPIPLQFDESGQLTAPTAGGYPTFTLTDGRTGAGTTFTGDLGAPGTATALTQFGGGTTARALGQDGSETGYLRSFSIADDGTVSGLFSNGRQKVLAQLAVATFNNPAGLVKSGSAHFRSSSSSGLPDVGIAGQAGRGRLAAGALEGSNVELAQEFTNLIVAQRGFQANSRVITSSDEMLQDLVNLKR